MSVREFLAEHAAASRAALALGGSVRLRVGPGCSSTVSDEDIERGIAHPGREAAMISEARAIDLKDEINRLTRAAG